MMTRKKRGVTAGFVWLACVCMLVGVAPVMADGPQRTLTATLLDKDILPLRQATLIVESDSAEPIKAQSLGNGVWSATGVGQKAVLHLQDPERGATKVEVTLPADDRVQVHVYWLKAGPEVRIASLRPLTPAKLQAEPSVSPGGSYKGMRQGTDCPGDALFSQTPHGPDDSWTFGTSEAVVDTNTYLRAEYFSGVSGDICDIHWWGLQLYLDPYYGWETCTEPSDAEYEIKFYEDAGGVPGAEVCSYTVDPTITNLGILYADLYSLLYYEVDPLASCCALTDGFVSIQGLGDTDCWFLWLSSGDGTASSCLDDGTGFACGVFDDSDFDLSMCLTGEYVETYGACCTDATAMCIDGVEQMDCEAPKRFAANTLCADLDPACGDIVTCDHTIVLTDDYGDGWNGGMVTVLVNGSPVLSGLTITTPYPNGTGPETHVFPAATGDTISTIYMPGSWSYENEYHIYDINGTQICADGVGGTTPVGGACGEGFCEADPCAGNEPANDECVNATSVSGPYPQSVNGTNYCATLDCPGDLDWYATWWAIDLPYAVNDLDISFCGNGFEINQAGVVYYDDCSDCSAYNLYDEIEWYDCADLVTAPQITFAEVAGPTTVYFPVMFNYDTMGPYTLEVNVTEVIPPPNDLCVDAIPVAVPSVTAGWTDAGTVDDGYDCLGGTVTAPGVWYSVTGTGNTMTADLCNGATAHDTKLTVICPECVDFQCVAYNDDDCGLQSSVSWCSQWGANYLILVHGYSSATGTFELTVSDDGAGCAADVACLPEGACCLPTGECVVINELACDYMGGGYQGDDTVCVPEGGVTLEFMAAYNYLGTGEAFEVNIFGGDNLLTWMEDHDAYGPGEEVSIDLGAYSGDTVQIEFRYYGDSWDYYAEVDDVVVPGGLALEDFNAGIPGDWTLVDTAGNGFYWMLNSDTGRTNYAGGDGTCAIADQDDYWDYPYDTSLITPAFVVPEPAAGVPFGACCLEDNSCVVTTDYCCEYAGGVFVGNDSDCGTGMMEVFSEDFNAGIPGDWTVTDDDGGGLMWNDNGYWADDNWTGGDGLCAEASSDTFGSSSYDTSLITPMIDLSAAVSAMLDFKANYQNFAGYDYFYVDVSYDGGGNWANLLTWNEDHGPFHGAPGEEVTLPLAGGSAMTQVRFRYYDPLTHYNWEIEVDDVVISAEVEGLSPCRDLDFKPGSCPNSFNRGSHGVLPTVLVGTEDFDVTLVDIASLTLERADGVGETVAPHEGPPGPHTVLDDDATPFDGVPCDCHELEGDGIDDVKMKFATDDVVSALAMDDLAPGALVKLVLRGALLDGTPFVASDCLRIVPPGTPPGQLAVQSNVAGAWVSATPLDNQLDEGGFASFERTYPQTSVVTLTAEARHQSRPFKGWRVNGQFVSTQRSIDVTVDGTVTQVKAVYGMFFTPGNLPPVQEGNQPPVIR